MLKIQPNLNKNLNKFLLKNNKKLLLSSLITATVLSAISSGACSKLNNSIIEDIKPKTSIVAYSLNHNKNTLEHILKYNLVIYLLLVKKQVIPIIIPKYVLYLV